MRIISGVHSYEELRGVVIDILLAKEHVPHGVGLYENLVKGVAEVLVRRGAEYKDEPYTSPNITRLGQSDIELVRDIFWDLFRQGIITLGRDENSEHWPWFRLSHHAKETLAKQSPYRFHDETSYLKLVRNEAPDVSPEAAAYLSEAIATYYADCLLASCVTLGVAAEIEFLRMIDQGERSPAHKTMFTKIQKARNIRQKIVAFQKAQGGIPKQILLKAGEDIDTHLTGIQSVLRVARNEAGHALANKPPLREQVYVYLQMFVPFVGHVARLRTALE